MFSSTWLCICFLFGFTLSTELPFQCPYKIPKDSPQPLSTIDPAKITGGGLLPNLGDDGLAANTKDVYAQYRAALALVPCDSRSISAFPTPLINGSNSVSVIFVYDKPVDDLKRWLE